MAVPPDLSLTIEAKIVGRPKQGFSDWKLTLPSEIATDSKNWQLHHLLSWVVQQGVAAFQERQQNQTLTQLLTNSQIELLASSLGKVSMGGKQQQEASRPVVVDISEAIQTALQAFEDGIYFIFLDGQQLTDLAQPVSFKTEGSKLLFVRLVALAGG